MTEKIATAEKELTKLDVLLSREKFAPRRC